MVGSKFSLPSSSISSLGRLIGLFLYFGFINAKGDYIKQQLTVNQLLRYNGTCELVLQTERVVMFFRKTIGECQKLS